MPFHLNQVNLSGTMTRQAEIAYTPKGTPVAKFGLAINRVWKDDAGTKHEDTTFVDVEAWGRTAEVIEEFTDKGHTIFIEGRLKLDQWEDKQTGAKRSKISVVCEKFHFVSKPKDTEDDDRGSGREERRGYGQGRESRQPPPRQQQRSAAAPRQPPPRDPDLDAPADDDDVPF